jgi:hypothetical protein
MAQNIVEMQVLPVIRGNREQHSNAIIAEARTHAEQEAEKVFHTKANGNGSNSVNRTTRSNRQIFKPSSGPFLLENSPSTRHFRGDYIAITVEEYLSDHVVDYLGLPLEDRKKLELDTKCVAREGVEKEELEDPNNEGKQ